MSESFWFAALGGVLGLLAALFPSDWLQQFPFGTPVLWRVIAGGVALLAVVLSFRASRNEQA